MNWILLVLISAGILSLRQFLVKRELKHNDSSILGALLLLIAVLLFPIFFSSKLTIGFDATTWYLFLMKASILATCTVLIFAAFKKLDISYVSPLMNLSPVGIIILGILLLGETLSFYQIIGISILIIGAYLIELNPKTHKFTMKSGTVYVFAWMALLAIIPIIDKVLLRTIDIYNVWFWPFAFATFILMGLLIYQGRGKEIIYTAKKNPLMIVFMAVLLVIDNLLWFQALSIPEVMVSLAIPIRRLSNIFNVFISGALFHEAHIVYRGLVTGLTLLGVYLIV